MDNDAATKNNKLELLMEEKAKNSSLEMDLEEQDFDPNGEANFFCDKLNISDISGINEDQDFEKKNSRVTTSNDNHSVDGNFSEELVNSFKFENEENLDTKTDKKMHKKFTKEDLDTTPLPIFGCIFCCNEEVSFAHYSRSILEDKYMLMTSKYNMDELERLISYPLIDKDSKNEELLNLVIRYTEYVKTFNNDKASALFLRSDFFKHLSSSQYKLLEKKFLQNVEDSVLPKKKDNLFKGIKNIPKNSIGTKGLFNSTNSMINNVGLSGFVGINNSLPSGDDINNNNNIVFKSNNMLGNIDEDNEKNNDDEEEIFDIFDLRRKINKDELKWETAPYDVWNPVIENIQEEDDTGDITNISEESFGCTEG